MTSVESEAFNASRTSSTADWDRAIVWFSFEKLLGGFFTKPHPVAPQRSGTRPGSYTPTGDVTYPPETASAALSCLCADARAPTDGLHCPLRCRLPARKQD